MFYYISIPNLGGTYTYCQGKSWNKCYFCGGDGEDGDCPKCGESGQVSAGCTNGL